MNHTIGWGVSAVLVAGVLNGTFVLPMKRLRTWKWENTWLVYSVVGLVLMPWVVAWATIPHLRAIFHETSESVIFRVLIFGFGWGTGSVLFGMGVSRLGMSIGYAIVVGLIAPVGTFLPL